MAKAKGRGYSTGVRLGERLDSSGELEVIIDIDGTEGSCFMSREMWEAFNERAMAMFDAKLKPPGASKAWMFDKWFTAQHGKAPGGRASLHQLAERMRRAQWAYNKALGVYQDRLLWEARRTTARYAWNIRDAEKGPRRRQR